MTCVQALRIETGKLQGISNDPEENYSNAVEIAENMRKRLAKCDEEFACLESDCKVRATESQALTYSCDHHSSMPKISTFCSVQQ